MNQKVNSEVDHSEVDHSEVDHSEVDHSEVEQDMLPEYDFTHGVRGMHHEGYKAGTNVIFLEPDLARIFKDSASANRILRLLLSLAKENVSTDRPA